MSLADSMDRYLTVASAVQGGRQRYDPQRPLWLPEREQLEEAVGFGIPDDVWVLWNHELFAGEQVVPLPEGVTVPGPLALLDGVFDNYGFLHFPVEEQIPLVRFFHESRLSLVGRVGRWPEVWLAGWFDSQTRCHQYQLGLAELFDAWSDGIEDEHFVWDSDSGGFGMPDHLVLNRPEYDPANRVSVSSYSVDPEQVDYAGALAAGAIFDQMHDDLDGLVSPMGVTRRAQWMQLVGPLPKGLA